MPLGRSFAIILLLALQALAASPDLHHLLHEDSQQASHQCPIKLMTDGQVDVEPGGGFQLPRCQFLMSSRQA
jgi:hypothetical protein